MSCFLITGCAEVEQSQTSVVVQDKLEVYLCDLTTSTDSAVTKQNMKKNITKLLRKLGPNTHYFVYPIGETVQSSLFTGYTGNDTDNATLYKANVQNYTRCIKAVENGFAGAQSKNTCIIDALQAAMDQVKYFKKDKQIDSVRLVVISDMMEACPVRGRWVNFEKVPFDSVGASWILEKWPEDHLFLKDNQLQEITVLYNTSTAVSQRELKQFWYEFFRKAGFTKEIYFPTDI
ncbi:MAG: hypothetical protein P0Y53_20885 [Candidatus Pseudobacter hemicellulosilyticus]|uniref:VWFA domain-containing protein n=1 Tax=Candidatus Pseudobacter hemicellulosilyticus TaxID=3121375 RepID=A0AAJ5WSM6_9BACT|nr:MAG: hypothetical protein P0Y53_20885 [Pseudobacter sp.]